jgi:Mg-chelatase subunit ChlD
MARAPSSLRVLLAGALALVVAAAAASSLPHARAQEGDDDRLLIRGVDVSELPSVTVELQLVGPAPDRTAFSVREGERLVPVQRVVPLEREVGTASLVLSIDRSGSLRTEDPADHARVAARSLVERAAEDDRIGVVAFDSRRVEGVIVQPEELLSPTTDRTGALGAIDDIELGGFTGLWDSIALAAAMLADEPTDERYIVVMSDAETDVYDLASEMTSEEAAEAAEDAGAAVLAVALPVGPLDDGQLRSVMDRTGGLLVYASDATQIEELFLELQASLRTRYELRYESRLQPGETAEITVTVGTSRAAAEVVVPEADTGEGEGGGDGGGGVPVPLIVGVVLLLGLGAMVIVRRR